MRPTLERQDYLGGFERSLEQLFLIKVKELAELIEIEGFDALVFLDRSARPFSWGLQEYWKKHPPAKKTSIRYFNPDIGQKLRGDKTFESEWNIPGLFGLVHQTSYGISGQDRIQQAMRTLNKATSDRGLEPFGSDEIPDPLRKIHFNESALAEMRAKIRLDSGSDRADAILIVDEECITGAGLFASMMAFEKVFPDKKVRGVTLIPLRHEGGARTPWPWVVRKGITGLIEDPSYSSVFSAPADDRPIVRYEREMDEKKEEVAFLFADAMRIIESHYQMVAKNPTFRENLEAVRSEIDKIDIKWLDEGGFDFSFWYLQNIFSPMAHGLDINSPSFQMPNFEAIQAKVATIKYLEYKCSNLHFDLSEAGGAAKEAQQFRRYVCKVVATGY